MKALGKCKMRIMRIQLSDLLGRVSFSIRLEMKECMLTSFAIAWELFLHFFFFSADKHKCPNLAESFIAAPSSGDMDAQVGGPEIKVPAGLPGGHQRQWRWQGQDFSATWPEGFQPVDLYTANKHLVDAGFKADKCMS